VTRRTPEQPARTIGQLFRETGRSDKTSGRSGMGRPARDPYRPLHNAAAERATRRAARLEEENVMKKWFATAAFVAVAASAVGAASADAVLEWNERAVALAVTVAKRPPGPAFVEVAITDLAMYDAVNAIAGEPYEPYAGPLGPAPGASADAAAAQAAHDVLAWLYPGSAPELDEALRASLAQLPDGPAKTTGVAVGGEAARRLIALRTGDGRDAPVAYEPEPGPGVWQPTPPQFLPAQAPWLPGVKPLVLDWASRFRPAPPPSLASRVYARAWDEVRRRGARDGAERTPDETEAALFWSEHPTTQYNRLFARIAARHEAGSVERARLFAALNAAAADALIANFDAKYHYGFWRPVHSIPGAGLDRNRHTAPDPSWEPLLVTPNHPEYPSAHSSLTEALVVVLAALEGPDEPAYEVDSTVTHTTHRFESAAEIEAEVREARITGGLHYRFSTSAGRTLGARVGLFLIEHAFRPSAAR
jgi:hypothetical protein